MQANGYTLVKTENNGIVRVFPMAQRIELMKATFLGLPVQNAWLPIAVMVAVTVICTGIAAKFFRWE